MSLSNKVNCPETVNEQVAEKIRQEIGHKKLLRLQVVINETIDKAYDNACWYQRLSYKISELSTKVIDSLVRILTPPPHSY